MSSKAALFVVVALMFVVLGGPAAIAQSGGDVTTARIEGTWRLTIHIDSYVLYDGGAPATGDPPAGHEEDQLVVFTPTCAAPGQCTLAPTDVGGNAEFVGASGFVGPRINTQFPLTQSGATYNYLSGVARPSCSFQPNMPPFVVTLALTVVSAAQDAKGSVATALQGTETIIVPSCPDPAGSHVYTLRTLTITQAVPVPPTTTTTATTTGAVATTAPALSAGAIPVAIIDRASGPAPIATALPKPSDAFNSLSRTAVNIAIAAAFLLLIVFPADLFNKTFDENHEAIRAGWERRISWLRERRQRLTDEAVARRRPITFVVVVVLGALFGGLLNPHFGANSASEASLLAALCAFVVAAVVSGLVAAGYRKKRKYPLTAYPKALPGGLLIAGVCVLISRLSSFEPGYLYGVVVGIAFTAELKKNEEGHLVALDSLATLAVAVGAWLLWVPVNTAALKAHAGFPTVFLDDFLGSVFVAGLVGTVLGLFPLSFMPGHKLAAWHRGVWAAVFGVAVFGLLQIVLLPTSDSSDRGSAPIVTAIVLFILFGAASIGFAAYWSRRKKQQTAAAYAGVAASISAVDPVDAVDEE